MSRMRRRWLALGGIFGAGISAVVLAALGTFAATGVAASNAKPVNTTPPTISGTPEEGATLRGNRGQWNNNPSDYNYYWLRCDKTGGSCAQITSAGGKLNYTLTSADVGNTIRFRVRAQNADGTTNATSVPTAVITRGTPTPPPASNGCPAGSPKQVSQMSLPTKLVIDRFEPTPSVLTAATESFQLRVHVTATAPCGGDVQGALVYGTATPFNQFSITEQPTDASGWATLSFSRQANFPVNSKQQILAMFLRARKSGENVLGGITGYRLVNVPVRQ